MKTCPDCFHKAGNCPIGCVCNCDAARAEDEASTLRTDLTRLRDAARALVAALPRRQCGAAATRTTAQLCLHICDECATGGVQTDVIDYAPALRTLLAALSESERGK